MIDGRFVMRDGIVGTVDEAAVRGRRRLAPMRLHKRAGTDAFKQRPWPNRTAGPSATVGMTKSEGSCKVECACSRRASLNGLPDPRTVLVDPWQSAARLEQPTLIRCNVRIATAGPLTFVIRASEGSAVAPLSIFGVRDHQRRRLDGFAAKQTGNRQNRNDVGQRRQQLRRNIAAAQLQRSCNASHAPNTSAASAAFPGFHRPKMTIPSAINPCPETIDSRNSPICASTR